MAEKLFDEEVFPVASPRLDGGALPRRPAELERCVLLRSERQPWMPWFRAMGLARGEPRRGPIFSDETLMLQRFVYMRLLQTVPVTRELALNHIATAGLGLPRSY